MTDSRSYDAVLKDLQAQRDKINIAIEAIESVRPSSKSDEKAERRWFHLSIADAAKCVLEENGGKALGVQEIYETLDKNGVNVSSANIVSSVLSRRAQQRQDIVRIGRGLWAIADAQTQAPDMGLQGLDEDDDL